MIRRILASLVALLCLGSVAKADFAFTTGTGATAFSFTASTGGTSLCAASVTHCFASVPINTAGAAIFTVAVPGQVTVTNANANGQAALAGASPVAVSKNSGTGSTIAGAAVGTAGTAATEVVSIQGIASMTPVLATPSPTSASAQALTDVVCGSGVSSCVLKASAGNFYGAYAECSAACWLMVFNATSAPSNGSTTAGKGSGNLVDCIAIPAGDQRSITYPTFPVALSVGITAAISSTTCATLTLATTGFVHGTVQ